MSKHEENSERTRRDLLKAGAIEFREGTGGPDPFKHVSLAQVAKRAGVSRNALAYHWPTKQDFSVALAEHLLLWADAFDEFFDATAAAVDATAGDPPLDRLLRLAEMDLAGLDNDKEWIAGQILTLVFAPTDESASAAARRGYRSIDELTWSHLYGRLLGSLERELRPPFTRSSFAVILQALVEGAAMRQLFEREAVAGSGDEPGAFALAAATLVVALSRPRHSSDDRSVIEVLEGQLRAT